MRSIRRKEGPKLSLQARRILESFPQDQFVLPTGCAWPPEEPGFLDLFSGERGVATEAAKFGVWSLCFDLEHGPAEDLQKEELQRRIEDGIKAGCFSSMGGGPVCSSFSMAITPPVRSAEWPYGKPNLSANMEMKVKEGNASALWMFSLLRLCLELKNPGMARKPSWVMDVSSSGLEGVRGRLPGVEVLGGGLLQIWKGVAEANPFCHNQSAW